MLDVAVGTANFSSTPKAEIGPPVPKVKRRRWFTSSLTDD
jgi:hypothetical protein